MKILQVEMLIFLAHDPEVNLTQFTSKWNMKKVELELQCINTMKSSAPLISRKCKVNCPYQNTWQDFQH